MVKKAIQKFHLNFLLAEQMGCFHGVYWELFSDFKETTQYLVGKGKT